MNNDSKIDVIVAGHICLDMTPEFSKTNKSDIRDILTPGKLVNMGRVRISTGGAVPNTGLALSVLGVNTKLMGKIGNDSFGEIILRILRKFDAQDGMLVVDDEDSSYTIVIAVPGIDRIFLHNPGANNTFCADDINYGLVEKAGLFHFGYPPLMKKTFENGCEELIKIFKNVKKLGVTTSLDMALPDASSESGMVDWDSALKTLLPYVDIFVPSVEEIMFMAKREDYDALNRTPGRDFLDKLDMNRLQAIGDKITSYGAKIVLIKCGIKGNYIRTQGKEKLAMMGKTKPSDLDNWAYRELLEESFHVENVVSATGAGDNSIAGFLASLIKGMSVEDSVKIACAVGAQNVQVTDAISGVKAWDETVEMIRKDWPKNRITVEGPYWRYDAAKKVWTGKNDCNFN